MAEWSHNLAVGGFAKIGYPGVLLLEGSADNVNEFVVLLKSLHWKAIAIRGEREEVFSDEASMNSARKFERRIRELSDKDLGILAQICKDAGVQDLFLAALKIEKAPL
jgi:hypothetical protein